MRWWLPDLSGINIWWVRGVFISVITMVQWMPLSKPLQVSRTFGNCFCALNNWSAMGHTGLGFRESSASNCADDPTRVGHVLGSFLHGAVRDRCLCPITGLELLDFVGST